MAEIVLAVGTSHSPQLSIPPEGWQALGEMDRANPDIPFAELERRRAKGLQSALNRAEWQARYARCQAAITQLGAFLTAQPLDALVVVGDDQGELWGPEEHPALAVFAGETVWDVPIDPKTVAPAYRPAMWAWHGTAPEPYAGHPALARHILEGLTRRGFDATQVTQQLPGRTLGHAFTFVRRRLGVPPSVPLVPVMLNEFFPPNIPTPARCVALGEALGDILASWADDKRIGLVASGGLTHFVIEEEIDRAVLDALVQQRPDRLADLPEAQLVSGSAEIRNWIVVAAAVAGRLRPNVVDYVPTYRSEAGTGVGMGFMIWQ
ncbi:MAG: protocatechuate 3,4-dioxygenase [Firmicutes bacterium]|nr:protocatechuate 3,4-dioxygenase [Alicyclobacillaceae bacterium]MCL6497379.1 protocatechuate 3,4-dioxygenase [Bacillota bacterium]